MNSPRAEKWTRFCAPPSPSFGTGRRDGVGTCGGVGYGNKAHPRATIRARAEELGHAGPRVAAAAAQYLAQQPKARLYAELPDFSYFRLVPVDVALNGGFGRAFRFAGALLID